MSSSMRDAAVEHTVDAASDCRLLSRMRPSRPSPIFACAPREADPSNFGLPGDLLAAEVTAPRSIAGGDDASPPMAADAAKFSVLLRGGGKRRCSRRCTPNEARRGPVSCGRNGDERVAGVVRLRGWWDMGVVGRG